MIHELDCIVQRKELIPMDCIDELSRRLASDKYTSDQALNILKCFTVAAYDKNRTFIVHKVWTELRKQNHNLQANHYKTMLNFYSVVGDPAGAEAMFDCLAGIGCTFNV